MSDTCSGKFDVVESLKKMHYKSGGDLVLFWVER